LINAKNTLCYLIYRRSRHESTYLLPPPSAQPSIQLKPIISVHPHFSQKEITIPVLSHLNHESTSEVMLVCSRFLREQR